MHDVKNSSVSRPGTKKMLFTGIAHSAKDSRLCYFLAKAIRNRYPNVECLYMGIESVDPERFSNEHLKVIEMPRGINPRKRRFRLHDMEVTARQIQKAGADLVQISDARELMLGFALKKMTSIPVIYDAHEDYFNQRFEYSGKSIAGLFGGIAARTREVLGVRYMDAVFCTDEFLERLYRFPLFASKSVTMVRNIPPLESIRSAPIFNQRDNLKLVYIGSVNRLRGIIETAESCARFNAEPEAARRGMSLSFHVYSRPNEIVESLARRGILIHHDYLPKPVLEKEIVECDIGVSLLQPCKKFERNILIKNFEYMAMGLPILTSNYGTMKRYVGEAGAGLLIDPTDYDAFRDAVLKLKDGNLRRALGQKGLAYARENFHRDVEVAPYLDTVGKLLGLV